MTCQMVTLGDGTCMGKVRGRRVFSFSSVPHQCKIKKQGVLCAVLLLGSLAHLVLDSTVFPGVITLVDLLPGYSSP